MAKTWYIFEYKYTGRPWIEYGRTQVKNMIDFYDENMRIEYKSAEDFRMRVKK